MKTIFVQELNKIFTYQKQHFYLSYSFPQPGTQMVSDSRQQKAKHRDSHQSVTDTEQFTPIRLWCDVSVT